MGVSIILTISFYYAFDGDGRIISNFTHTTTAAGNITLLANAAAGFKGEISE